MSADKQKVWMCRNTDVVDGSEEIEKGVWTRRTELIINRFVIACK
jgi:hypothetical protein